MKTCDDCKFAILEDFGYSNYTVEGTNFSCALALHPDKRFDHWYGEDARLEHAEKCVGFQEGTPINMDVEGDDYNTLTQEQKHIYDNRKT